MIRTPERSHEQRMAALLNANATRTHRAKLKEDVKRGRRSVIDVWGAPHEREETMKVIELLLAMPSVGRVKANKLLLKAKISPSKTLGGLTERQRLELRSLVMRTCVQVRPLPARSGS